MKSCGCFFDTVSFYLEWTKSKLIISFQKVTIFSVNNYF